MESGLIVAVIFRWMHIGSAIVVVGGSVFMRFILMPAAAELPEAEHTALRARMMKKWKFFVHTAILLFLISGFYNYLWVALPAHKGDKLYSALIGIKILLAFAVFFLAIALTGKSKWSESYRQNSRHWLAVNIALAAAIVGISGVLKNRLPKNALPTANSSAQQHSQTIESAEPGTSK